MRTESRRPGQALVELALGMFVFALILSALLSFAAIIPESVRLQSLVRALAVLKKTIKLSTNAGERLVVLSSKTFY